MVVEVVEEVELKVVSVRRGLPWVVHGTFFFGCPFPAVPSPLQVGAGLHFFCLVGSIFLFNLFCCW